MCSSVTDPPRTVGGSVSPGPWELSNGCWGVSNTGELVASGERIETSSPALDRRSGDGSAGLGVGRAAGEVGQRRLDAAGGEVGGPLADLLEGAEPHIPDLPLLADDGVQRRDVDHAAVEDEAQRVVPAAPRGQPVGEQEPAGLDVQRELLLDFATGSQLRRLADLDHAARQVPVALVGQLAQQHPVVVVAHEQLADRALAGQERVEKRAEALRVRDRGIGREATEDHQARGVGHPSYTFAAQAGAGGDAQRRGVVGLDVGLDPAQAEPALAALGEGEVGHHLDGTRGVAAAALPGGQRPGQLSDACVAAHLALAHGLGAGAGADRPSRGRLIGHSRVTVPSVSMGRSVREVTLSD